MGLKEKFAGFIVDNSYLQDYRQYEIIGSKILLRMFVFVPKPTGLLDADGKDLSAKLKLSIFPFAKVIKLGTGVTADYTHLQPGDIVHMSDDITKVQLNPEWIAWKQMQDQRPKPQVMADQEPQPFVGNIARLKDYVFIADKFNNEPTTEDMFTYALPQNFVLGKWNEN
jgi:hypothetical protein